MNTAAEKGNALERAVEAIEDLILSTSPTLQGSPFTIESKKILAVAGVRHEIDILVTVDCGHGYSSTFIFECKNWKDSVGKNDIIIFSEKIDASSSTKGFFVAKSFTSDAEAQAAKDNRITLLLATEHNVAETPASFKIHHVMIKDLKKQISLQVDGGPSTGRRIKMAGVEVRLNGVQIDPGKYVHELALGACTEKARQMDCGDLPDGDYPNTATIVLKYPKGEFVVGERMVSGIRIATTFVVTIIRPKIRAHFDVAGRGRSIEFEPIVTPEGTFDYGIAATLS